MRMTLVQVRKFRSEVRRLLAEMLRVWFLVFPLLLNAAICCPLRTLKVLQRQAASLFSAGLLFGSSPIHAAETFQQQVLAIQTQQNLVQKGQMDAGEQELLTREIQYPDGKLVAKGMVVLKSADGRSLPYGYSKAADLDSVYASEDATLFLLAVGAEGPILAASKYPLRDLHFPKVFEILDTDILPPYTKETWVDSANAASPVAVTAILSTTNNLAHPQGYEKIGVAVSLPSTFASKKIRTTGRINVSDSLKLSMYTPTQLEVFGKIDAVLDEKAKAGDNTGSVARAADSGSNSNIDSSRKGEHSSGRNEGKKAVAKKKPPGWL